MSKNYLDQLAEMVHSLRWEDMPTAARCAAKNVVLDTIGAILAGSQLPENAAFAQLAAKLGGKGTASIFGHFTQVPALFAALVNATAGVALEMDEGNRLGGGHPSVHVTPGAIAVAEDLGLSGTEVLMAIILGYEVTSRIGTGTSVRPEVHSHGTWGTIGSAAATARLMGFDKARIRQAMNLSMSMSPANTWTPCLEGATIRNLYPGRSSFQGIMAAHLVECGFSSIEDGPADLYNGILGEGFDSESVVEGLGGPGKYRIQQNYFKMHACCLYNHPVLDAVQALQEREGFVAGQVSQVQVVTPAIALIMADPVPKNMLAAKFSIPFAVASALVLGRTDVGAFLSEQVANPQVLAMAQKVAVTADEAMSLRRYDYPAARVSITLDNGRVLEKSVTVQRGDAENPISQQVLEDKFVELSQSVLGEDKTLRVIDVVQRLDDLSDIRDLTRLLRVS